MHDKIKKVIENYLSKNNIDYGILINGDWGCGKTYFINEYFLSNNNKIIVNNNEINCVYISLSGISDIDKLLNEIYIKIALINNNIKIYNYISKTVNFITDIGTQINTIGIDKYSKLAKNIVKSVDKFIFKKHNKYYNTLLILDDLERLSYSKIEDFLYRIHNLFILNGLKTLFIANEKEIKDVNYLKIKEKVIRHTISFYELDNKTFKEIAKNIISKYYNEIPDDFFINHLIYIFIYRNCLNLRIFLTYLDFMIDIINIFDPNELKNNFFISNLLLEFSFILIEIKYSNYNKLLYWYDVNLLSKLYANKETNQEIFDYINNLNDMGITFHKEKIFFNTITNYIQTGYLNTNVILDYYKAYLESKDMEIFDEDYNNLYKYNILDDNEIKNSIKIIFDKTNKYINEKKINNDFISKYNNLMKVFDRYPNELYESEIKKFNELFIKLIDYYFDNLDLTIDENIKSIVSNFYENKHRINRKNLYNNKLINDIDIHRQKRLKEAYELSKENVSEKIIILFITEEINSYKYFGNNQYICGFNVYKDFITKYDFLKKLKVTAENISIIIDFLNNFILDIGNANQYSTEHELELQEIEKYISEIDKNKYESNKINYQINLLKDTVEKCKKHIAKIV
ncbi:P-loop NTPase fold protein [Brachyspira pulli]|uniref:P-loop NTPase fold protein n=1 Tax=Brachyspira pulli TaxID=310721 RepID=UPI0030069195